MKSSSNSIGESMPTPGQPSPGDWIGKKYRLKELRGAGGMGTVWVAHNAVLDIDVALKLMRFEQFRADPKRIFRRLLQEARAAARLEHPAIVRVFDFGLTDAGSPYIVMELLRGESLAELMARQPSMDATRAVQLLLPIADALATAHGRGIIHRDIKPENLFLATDEYGRLQPKIVDFGVARFLEGGRTMTRSGALMGTPDYMAPEQARGEADIDTRVDIWALCVVLYELIAGFRPFGSPDANYLAVLRAIVHDEPNAQIKAIAGDALWLILERGLRKKTHERWDTMRVLGEALALWLYERGVREDILGSSIKSTWLQSGLGGVKIETASMSPPAGAEANAAADFKAGESGSLPVLAGAPANEQVVRPAVNVSLAGVRPNFQHQSLSLPSPKRARAEAGVNRSLSDAIDEVLMLPPVGPSDPTLDSDPSQPIEVTFAENEAPTEPISNSRPIELTPDPSSSPLVQQTRELRRLVLTSIAVTALLALAVVALLWDQRRVAKPVALDPPMPTASNSEPKSKPGTAKQAKPSETAPRDAAPSPAAPEATSPETTPAPPPSATGSIAGDAPESAADAAPAPKAPTVRIKPRSYPRKKKTKYELGF